MADRYDVLTARESNGKTYWTKLGAMFPNRNGEGFTLMLDAMPAPQDGQFKLTAMVPKPRDDNRSAPRQQARQSASDDDDFGAPF